MIRVGKDQPGPDGAMVIGPARSKQVGKLRTDLRSVLDPAQVVECTLQSEMALHRSGRGICST
jgi:hypothetical protein